MTELGSISRSVLADQVKDRLLQDILSRRCPPDARIVETRVAREVGPSEPRCARCSAGSRRGMEALPGT
jgi:DNA-binding GntR family transcriptional regulator